MRWLRIPGVVAVALALVSQAGGASVSVSAFKHSEPAFETHVEVDLAGVTGVTGVTALRPDATPVVLNEYAADQFGSLVGPFGSFAAFHGATVGDWRLTVEFGSGNDAVYDMKVNDFRTPFVSTSFPPAPTVSAPVDGATGVATSPTFVWDNGGSHTGAMESLFVSVWNVANPAIGVFEGSSGGPITLNAETWSPAIVLPAGAAEFLVQYETNENEGANVDDPVFNAGLSTVGDPGIVWDSSSGDLFSRDVIGFQVVPEPGTLLLIALGVPALAARPRRRRGPGAP